MTHNLEKFWTQVGDVAEILNIPSKNSKGEWRRATGAEIAMMKEYLRNIRAGNPNKGHFVQKYKKIYKSASSDQKAFE